jgi:peptidyl-tRNA hydrolase
MIRANSMKRMHYYPAVQIGPDGKSRPYLYKSSGMYKLAVEAFERGEEIFYCKRSNPDDPYSDLVYQEPYYDYHCSMDMDKELYEDWLGGIFTKVVCEAKNRAALDKAIRLANMLGLKEGVDYFLIKDACLTELTPEEVDENGQGRTLTCIGFRPLPDDIAEKISKKFQLYK